MNFAHNLRKIRESKGIAQKELAQKVGVGKSTICSYESGRRKNVSKPILKALAEALQVSVADLLGMQTDIAIAERMFGEKVEIALYNEDGIITDVLTPSEYQNVTERIVPAVTIAKDSIISAPAEMVAHEMEKLNDIGQQEAVRQISLLTKIPEFRKKT